MEDQATMENHITKVRKRNGRIVEFNPDRITNAIFRAAKELGGENLDIAKKMTRQVVKRLNERFKPGEVPHVEQIQDIVIETLYENDYDNTATLYKNYREQHAQERLRYENQYGVVNSIPYKVIYNVLVWNIDHNCDSVDKLNEIVESGKFGDLVKAGEEKYHYDVDQLVSAILRRKNEIRIIIIAGPSSSGKTTTTIKVSERLQKHNLELVALNLDNYFRDLESNPKDEFGDYDFEKPEALDLELINDHLSKLLEGKTIQMPYYNFKTGKREWHPEHTFKVEKNQFILLDSLHGFYPPMTESVPADMKFKFYIEAFCQVRDKRGEYVRWADLRMFRRMVRDSWHRSYDPERTVGHWHYVRRSEMRHIVPFVNEADFIMNGSLPYELPVHRKYLAPYLDEIYEEYKDNVKRFDAAIRAKRIYDLLTSIVPITDEDEKKIPPDSLMREFIGGSIYKY